MDFDEVRVLPVYQHMYEDKRERGQAPFHHRVEMCKLCFGGIPGVVVSEAERTCFENKQSGTVEDDANIQIVRIGTADLLDMLTVNEQDVDFTWAIGEDAFVDMAGGKWRRAEDIFEMVGHRLVVFRRSSSSEDDGEKLSSNKEAERMLWEGVRRWSRNASLPCDNCNDKLLSQTINVTQIPTLTGVSSSTARVTADETVLSEMLSSEVLEYIRRNRMYAFSVDEDNTG